jgi:hypothetical protein
MYCYLDQAETKVHSFSLVFDINLSEKRGSGMKQRIDSLLLTWSWAAGAGVINIRAMPTCYAWY